MKRKDLEVFNKVLQKEGNRIQRLHNPREDSEQYPN